MYWDRFDICEAYYVYAVNCHGGQWTRAYEVFGRLDKLGFFPSPLLDRQALTENGKAIYDNLKKRDY